MRQALKAVKQPGFLSPRLWRKPFGEDSVIRFSRTNVAGCRVNCRDAQSDPVRRLFLPRDKERSLKAAGILGVEHLQSLDNAIADQEFAVYADLTGIPIAVRTDEGA